MFSYQFILQALRESPTTIEDGGEWRQFTIPVDFPRLDVGSLRIRMQHSI